MNWSRGRVGVGLVLALEVTTVGVRAQAPQTFQTPQALIHAMIERENQMHHDRYEFVVNERSDRTGGHLWTERVVEIPAGRVVRLMEEDGQPISAERAQVEKAKLDAMASDPAAFAKSQEQAANDEIHARQMLDLLPKAFLLENVRLEGGVWKVDYRPDPAYSPSGMEEHVLHGMSGWLAIDAKDLRLVHIEGHLAQDLSLDFGLLAIKSGSHFSSDREKLDGHWRTVRVLTDIRGKAALFKVAKNSDVTRSEFRYLPADVTPAQAVALVEQ